jgi:hypothetical protein
MRELEGLATGGWLLVLFKMHAESISKNRHNFSLQPYFTQGLVYRSLGND